MNEENARIFVDNHINSYVYSQSEKYIGKLVGYRIIDKRLELIIRIEASSFISGYSSDVITNEYISYINNDYINLFADNIICLPIEWCYFHEGLSIHAIFIKHFKNGTPLLNLLK